MHSQFDVITAQNGQDGLHIARDVLPDLIISDVNMPGLNGHAVLKKLQDDASTTNIPFIFLTGNSDIDDFRAGMSLGADDYLMKPVDINHLTTAVKTRLNKHDKLTQSYREEITRTMQSLQMTINYDESTRLPKKAILEKQIKKAKQAQPSSANIALMIIKLDRFRGMADVLGSSLIMLLIERLREVFSEEEDLYWLDNDEFALLCAKDPDEKFLTVMAENLLTNIRRTFLHQDQELHFNASIGISQSKLKEVNFIRLLSEAELALNYAVEQGYSNFKFYEPNIKKHVFQRIRLEGALHRAVERKEFVIFYQPKIRLSDSSIGGIEALVRWEHEELGTVSPSQFIPIAESNGLITEIGEWITESICKQITAWKNAGIKSPRVAINVSGIQLEKPDFYDRMFNILDKNNISGENLEFELTESILVRHSEEMAAKLTRFKQMGVNISIDDFGTGYSSLQYLKNFPHDKIKIDQSFIRDLTIDKNSASIVTTIISMAHQMGVKVIAEGVESKEQVDFLREHDCDEIQGYYYSKPVSAEFLPDLFARYER
jgi:EAL domain-containing protein (putative c-di-GMP-specific phosphodiesterase class I)/DNA-binding response OmpR family regulator